MAAEESSKPLSEGFSIQNPSEDDLREALDAAFDYRGDVTLTLRSGDRLTGYIFNRVSSAAEPYLDLFPENSEEKRRIQYADINGVSFSGRDTASGKSWETWAKTYEEKKAARDRGEDVGTIGLNPDPL